MAETGEPLAGQRIYLGTAGHDLEGFGFELRNVLGAMEDVAWSRFLHDDAEIDERIRTAKIAIFLIGHIPGAPGRIENDMQRARDANVPMVVIVIDAPDWAVPVADEDAWRQFRGYLTDDYSHAVLVRDVAGLTAAVSAALAAQGLIHEPVSAYLKALARRGELPSPPVAAEGSVPRRAKMKNGGPPRALMADVPPIREERVVNVKFARRKKVLPKTLTIQKDETYAVRVSIGARDEEGITLDPKPIDLKLLPKGGNWLDVGITSASFVTPDRTSRVWLPEEGPAWVCACKDRHRCKPQERAPHLDLKVKAPKGPGLHTLRLAVYFRNNVVQSQRIAVRVGAREEEAPDAQVALVDYTLTKDLSKIGGLEHRPLSILTNDDKGTHSIIIRGDKGRTLTWHIAEKVVASALKDVRYHLRAIHTDPDAPEGQGPNYLQPDGSKKPEDLAKDIRDLAFRGWNLFSELRTGTKAEDAAKRFAEIVGEEPVPIHLARAGGTGLAYPFAFVYDIPLRSDPASWKNCRILAELHRFNDEKLTSCPYGPHAKNTICPFGFWGVRLELEQPPSTLIEQPPIVNAPPGGLLVVAEHSGLANAMGLHESALRSLAPRLTLDRRASFDAIEQAVADPAISLLYFYCHGAQKQLASGSETMCLLVGADETISPGDVVGWFGEGPQGDALRATWAKRQPLVFINGCHTVRATPESGTNFVDTFGQFQAGGVIGTEIPIEQGFANEAARIFLESFVKQNKTVGGSMRALRHHFLARGNALGLAYTAYAFSKLKLAEA